MDNWTMVVASSLQGVWAGVASVLANIVGAVLILIIGLIVAHYLGKLVEEVIKAVKLDSALNGLGLEKFFNRGGMTLNSGEFFGRLVYWFLVVVFILAASDVLGFYALSNFLRDALLYIPNVLVAALIMLAGVVIANTLRKLVRASVKSADLHAASFLGSLVWWSIVLFGFFAALSQLGIAVAIVNSIVTGFVAMLALAGGIAFGMGGKDYAAYLVSKLRDHTER